MEKMFYSMKEAAEQLGVSWEAIRQWRKGRKSFCRYVTRVGNSPVISKDNLRRYVEGLPSVAEEAAGKEVANA